MHGVIPYRPSRLGPIDSVGGYLPMIGFALLPFAVLAIATAIQAHGFPSLSALATVLTIVGSALGQF